MLWPAKLPNPSAVHRYGSGYLLLLSLLLLGYALMGKGVAYLRVGPVFIGDMVLVLGLAIVLFTRGAVPVLSSLPARLLLALAILGALRMLGDVDTYGLTALRDGAIWGYGLFAFIIGGLLVAEPSRLRLLLRRFGFMARWYPLVILPLWLLQLCAYDTLPHMPGSDVPIIYQKAGDIMVHLCGSLSFVVAMHSPVGFLYEIAFLVVAAIVSVGRGAMLSLLAGVGLLVFFRPSSRVLRRIGAMAMAGLILMAISGATFRIPMVKRDISFEQLTQNIGSLVGNSSNDALIGTRNWRLDWWKSIANDTFHGPYFWSGQGFGVNLADAYGYQVDDEGSLRSPHNAYVTIIARMGVPGIVLWIAIQATWIGRMLLDIRHSFVHGRRQWSALFVCLLVYWVPFLVNGSFDVFLEGPMGGIWFWCIFGVGLAASRLYRQCPGLLDDLLPQAAAVARRRARNGSSSTGAGATMTILKVHNHYQQPGGEDNTVEAEIQLLRSRGHRVVRFDVHNDAIKRMNLVSVAARTVWSHASYRQIRQAVRDCRADIVHFHNTFPLISPAGYYAAHAEGAAVVQTLHNYRLLCCNGLFYRDGHVCEDCLHQRSNLPAVRHGCYHGALGSAAAAAMLAVHHFAGTYRDAVDVYIAMTRFGRDKFIEGGLPPEKIIVKPHFLVTDPGPGRGGGGYALFVGRLSAEKGVANLLQAWNDGGDSLIPLRIIGDGPLAAEVQAACQRNPRIQWFGRRTLDEIFPVLGEAEFLVYPSGCYETFGRTAIEAYATGTPVLASNQGAVAEAVDDGRTGLLFTAGSPADLRVKARQIMSDRSRLAHMRREARLEYESRYTAAGNYPMMLAAFGLALRRLHSPAAQGACAGACCLR